MQSHFSEISDALWEVLKLGLQEGVKILCNIEVDSPKLAYQWTEKIFQ